MFPISDIEKAGRFGFITWAIIIINIIVFLNMLGSADQDGFIGRYALIPVNINPSDWSTFNPFITSMFLHGGLLHIFSNMWFLRIFGDNVEDRLGTIKYLFLYFASGIGGGIAQYIFNPNSTIPMIGASAAVSGVLGAYMAYFPHHRIRSVVLLFIVITFVNIPAGIYLFYWFAIQFLQGAASIPTLQNEMGGVAFLAHVGGFAVGYIFAKLNREDKKVDYIEGEVVG